MQPHVATHHSAIRAYRQDQQWSAALKLFVQAQLQPSVITNGAAIAACKKGQQWATSLEFFYPTQQSKVQPHVVTCNSSIIAYGRGSEAILLSVPGAS